MSMPRFYRYFFALMPPFGVLRELARFDPLIGGRPVEAARRHVTLLLLNRDEPLGEGVVWSAMQAMAHAILPQARLLFDGLVLAEKSALLHPSEELPSFSHLHRRLRLCLARAGVKPDDSAPRPHLTLAYEAAQGGHCAIDPISWTADRLVLIESAVGLHQNRQLGAWPLVAMH